LSRVSLNENPPDSPQTREDTADPNPASGGTRNAPFTGARRGDDSSGSAFDTGVDAIHEEHLRRERLRNRHEGLAWLIWGLVAPTIFVTLEAAGLLFSTGALSVTAQAAGQYPWWVVLFWLPWVFAGALAVHLLWRSAVVRDPDIKEGRPSVPLVVFGWIVVIALTWLGIQLAIPGLNSSVYLTLGIGLAWTLTGVVDPFELTYHGRRVTAAVGLAVLATGAVSLVAFPPWPAPASLYASWAGALATAIAPFAGGLYQIRYCGEEERPPSA